MIKKMKIAKQFVSMDSIVLQKCLLGCFFLISLLAAFFLGSFVVVDPQYQFVFFLFIGALFFAIAFGGYKSVDQLLMKVKESSTLLLEKRLQEKENAQDLAHEKSLELWRTKVERLNERLLESQKGYEQKLTSLQNYNGQAKMLVDQLHNEMDQNHEEQRRTQLKLEDLKKENRELLQELDFVRKEEEQKQLRRENILIEYQRTIHIQREVLENKQEKIEMLSQKIKDLSYELKMLLKLENSGQTHLLEENPSGIQTLYSYYLPQPEKHEVQKDQLEQYIEKIMHFQGAVHLNSRQGRSQKFFISSSSFEIDLRRLYDIFREETTGIIFFFSPEEKRFLFVNDYVKELLGHSPEKFVYHFSKIVEKGLDSFFSAIQALSTKKTVQVRLMMLNHLREPKLFTCQMTSLFEGPFEGCVLGLIS